MLGTPNALEILIHYYCTVEQHPRCEAPAVQDDIKFLHKEGLLDRTDFPKVTDKGEFFLQHLLSIPFPVQKWEIPEKDEP
jgi:hypothetical protein